MSRMRRHVSGFTLIELLVVIAIIAILAAILFPVFARARENARKSTCQSNLKQIAMGMIQYVQDYDERMPHCRYTPDDFRAPSAYTGTPLTPSWPQFIAPYLKNTGVLKCPSDDRARPHYTNGANNMELWSYGRNYGYFNGAKKNAADALALSEIAVPSDTIMIGEGDNCNRIGPRSVDWPGNGNVSVDAKISTQLLEPRHMDGMNFAFFDGHVKWFRHGGTPARLYSVEED